MSAVCRSSFIFTVACMCPCVHVCSERYAEQLPEICLEGVSSPTQPTPSTSSLFGGLLGRRQAQLNRTELCESSTGVNGSHCRAIRITNLIVCPSVCLSVTTSVGSGSGWTSSVARTASGPAAVHMRQDPGAQDGLTGAVQQTLQVSRGSLSHREGQQTSQALLPPSSTDSRSSSSIPQQCNLSYLCVLPVFSIFCLYSLPPSFISPFPPSLPPSSVSPLLSLPSLPPSSVSPLLSLPSLPPSSVSPLLSLLPSLSRCPLH